MRSHGSDWAHLLIDDLFFQTKLLFAQINRVCTPESGQVRKKCRVYSRRKSFVCAQTCRFHQSRRSAEPTGRINRFPAEQQEDESGPNPVQSPPDYVIHASVPLLTNPVARSLLFYNKFPINSDDEKIYQFPLGFKAAPRPACCEQNRWHIMPHQHVHT